MVTLIHNLINNFRVWKKEYMPVGKSADEDANVSGIVDVVRTKVLDFEPNVRRDTRHPFKLNAVKNQL